MERSQGAINCLQSTMLRGPVLGIMGLSVKKFMITFSLLCLLGVW